MNIKQINIRKKDFKITPLQFKNKALSFVVNLFCFIILISVGYIILYPLLYSIVTSFRTVESYLDPTRSWIFKVFSLDGYKRAIKFIDFKNSFLNTLKYEVVSALLEVGSCAVAAYGFSRFKFKTKGLWMAILFISIMLPSTMIIIPLVTNFSKMDILGIFGLLNKLTGVDLRINLMGTPLTYWLPSLLGVGLRSGILIYIYIQFFKGLPKEFEEAAWIDGAGPIKTFLTIIIPSSKVVIITVTVFSLVWHWNDFYLASMYSTGKNTLAVAVTELPSVIMANNIWDDGTRNICILAGVVLFVVPLLIVYMFLQRGFIESIDRVGITG